MQKFALVLFFLSITFHLFSQENNKKVDTVIQEAEVILKGRVISINDNLPLQSAHIVNLNAIIGTITTSDGQFKIPAKVNDTIFISYIGYQSVKLKITRDLLKGNELEIAIHEKVLNIEEVTVKSHNLIGVLVVDAKNVPEDVYSRIHIKGLPQAYEIGSARGTYNSGITDIFSPIDFWYKKLGKKPKNLDRLRKLKEGDQMRGMMEQKYNREIMMDFLDMSRKELNDLLSQCSYSSNFIRRASDLQVIEAVLECYENYRAIKNGSVTREIIHINDTFR